MIGRAAERRRIGRFLAEGARRHTVCLLSGDAGLGKSTLLAEAVDTARRRGTTVLHTAPAEGRRDSPFSALDDLIAPRLPPARTVDPGEVAAATLRFVRDAAARAPVLVAVDDLEWVDDSSWQALLFALRRVEPDRVAVLVAVRSPESSARAGAVLRSAGTGRVHRIRLEPLAGEEIEGVLRAQELLPAPAAARRWVLETAGGNPYAALELAAAIRREDAAALPDVIPQALSIVLRRALEGQPPRAVRALLAVSLSGGATRELAEALLGRGADAALDEALSRRLLVDRGAAGLRPAHPLLAAAAVEASSTRERRALHRRLAVEAPDAVERGLHLARGTAAPDAAAAASVEAAAAVALRRGAPAEAARLYGHAVRLTSIAAAHDRLRRSLERADALASAGDARAAITVLEPVARELEPSGDRAAVLARLGALRYRVDRVDAAVRTFRDAVGESARRPGLRTDILRRLALAEMMSGDLGAAAAVAAEAAASARGAAVAETTRFEAMLSTVIGLPGAGERAAAPEDATTTVGLDVPTELRPATIRALATTVVHGSTQGALELGELCRRAEHAGDWASLPYLLANLCEAQLAAGSWDDAERLAVKARMLADDEPDAMSAFLLAALSRLATARGRVTEARALGLRGLNLARAAGMVPAIHYSEAALGFLELTRGRHAAVDARLGSLVDGLASLGLGEPMFARFVPDLIESRIRLGRVDAAVSALDWWEERGRTLGRPFALATGARCRALLLGAADEPRGAEAALADARGHHAALDEPFELARTELVAGLVHRRARRRGVAHTAFVAAIETFRSLGAPLWTATAEAELARLGAHAPAGPSGLTGSERRVVELVAAGHTNREAARMLFVAESTIEAALWRIYRKLDVRSRTELTRWALGAPDAPPPPAGRPASRPPRA